MTKLAPELPFYRWEPEATIITGYLQGFEYIIEAAQDLTPDLFGDRHLRAIFEAIREVEASGEPVNHASVRNRLEQAGHLQLAGGNHNLKRLATQEIDLRVSPDGIRAELATIRDWATRRRLANALRTAVHELAQPEGDLNSITRRLDAAVDEARTQQHSGEPMSLAEAGERFKELLEKQRDDPLRNIIPSGYRDIDLRTGGLKRKKMTVLAARPGMAKSALAGNIGARAARAGHKVLFFSLEMDWDEVYARLLADEARYSLSKLRFRRIPEGDWDGVEEGTLQLSGLPFWLQWRRGQSVSEIRAQCLQHKKRHGLDLVIIDYLGNIEDVRQATANKTAVIGQATKGLRNMLQDLDAGLLLIHQLNRGPEREKRRPRLSDLRDSGEIEQDADMVWFLWDEHYQDSEHLARTGNATRDIKIIVGKNRDGAEGVVINLTFQGDFMRFTPRTFEGRFGEPPPDRKQGGHRS